MEISSIELPLIPRWGLAWLPLRGRGKAEEILN